MDTLDSESIILYPKDDQQGKGVQFRSQLRDLSNLVASLNQQESVQVDVSKEVLLLIHRFLEEHDYDEKQVKVQKPLTSSNPKDCFDSKTYDLLIPYKGSENIQKMKPLVDAAYYLNIECFKEACQAMIACEFYIGSTEQELAYFQEKHNLPSLDPEEEIAIMNEFAPVFEQLNSKFKQQLEEEQRAENKN